MTPPAIELRGVSKRFRLRAGRGQWTLKSAIVDALRRRRLLRDDRFEALHGIDLTVARGEALGIIGENGSGKSTLLRLIARIYRPDTGTVRVEGRVAALIELGAGFHPEFTGRENIAVSGMLLGLSRHEVLDRLDEIVEFADIGEFIDQPARTYSSGMLMRLGFSVAVHLDPDVLLIDEALAVGDEAFAAKCGARLADFRERGKTMVLVSHDASAVERWCDQAIWLGRGVVRAIGHPRAVIESYHRALASSGSGHPAGAEAPRPRDGGGEPLAVEIDDVRLTGDDGAPRETFRTGELLRATVAYRQTAPGAARFSFAVLRADGLCVYGTRMPEPEAAGVGEGALEITIDSLDLVGGAYIFQVAADGVEGLPGDTGRHAFQVAATRHEIGVAHLRHRWRVIQTAAR
jgi:ABC-type polysaccharide/polyol phosphate transport system ATPase subunit